MKKIALFLIGITVSLHTLAQDHVDGVAQKMPDVKVQDINGRVVSTGSLGVKGPMIISFWATWCSPCKRELNTIHEEYADWVSETGVTLVAVSIDDEKTKMSVAPYVDSKGWEYLILLDPNGDLKRAMGVGNPPQTFLIDENGNIVYSHIGYAPGDEQKLYEELLKLLKKK
jgi:peroxiredoxin